MTSAARQDSASGPARRGGGPARQGSGMDGGLFAQASRVMLSLGREVELPKGHELRNNNIYLLLKGSMALCSVESTGEIQELLYFEPGMLTNFVPTLTAILPLHALTMNRLVVRENFVQRARTDCRCAEVPSPVFIREHETNPVLRKLLLLALTENLLNMFAMACNSPAMPAAQRICRLLLQFAARTEPHVVNHAFTYDEIAAHLSLHAMTVAKVFKALKERGAVLRKGRRIVVADLEAVREVANGSRALSYS